MIPVPWSEQFRWREKVHRQYPEIWDLRIVRKRILFIITYLRERDTLLDIGAYNHELENRIKKYCPHILYRSLDIDLSFPYDYSSLDEVNEKFDMILLLDVIEHLDWDKGREMVAKIFWILKPGGKVIVTTPNVYAPGQYWKDVSHCTPYHYEELGPLFLSQGFQAIEIYRLFNAPFLRYVMKVYFFLSYFVFWQSIMQDRFCY